MLIWLLLKYYSSASGQEPDKKGKRPVESRSAKRRFNEHQSDAEILDWDSDSDGAFDETEIKRKTISKWSQ